MDHRKIVSGLALCAIAGALVLGQHVGPAGAVGGDDSVWSAATGEAPSPVHLGAPPGLSGPFPVNENIVYGPSSAGIWEMAAASDGEGFFVVWTHGPRSSPELRGARVTAAGAVLADLAKGA